MRNVSAGSLRALVAASPHAIFDLDAEGRVVETWNAAAVRILGWTRSEVIGKPLPYVPDHALEEFRRTRARVFAGEVITGVRAIRRRKDGALIEVSIAAAPVHDGAGPVTRIMCIVENVTSQRAQEAELARLGVAVEQSEVITIITEVDGAIRYVNPAFTRVTGYSRSEVIGRNPRILKSGLQGGSFYQELWRTLTTGGVWRGRIRNKRKDGTLYTADVCMSPVRDGTGVVTGYIGLQRDITHQVELDEQLRQAQKMEALGQLTSGIAHDFNNLLTVIQANAELLGIEADALSSENASCLDDIGAAARRGAAMIRRLMVLGRNEQLLFESVDLAGELEEFVRTLRRILPASIRIDLDLRDRLPPARADRGAVQQILLNLATNARDAMPEGGRLTLRLFPDEGELQSIEVADDGVGMDEETLRRAFEPFFTTKSLGKGTGLGMSMVYRLMSQHHGRVTLESRPGQGTRVKLSFPGDPGAGPFPAVTGRPAARRGSERILLVEDEETVRRVGRRVLEHHGYQVVEAADGLAALAILEGNPAGFDLVLSDQVMPRMGGIELRHELARRHIPARFLLATGYSENDGAEVLQKPWTSETLSAAIRRALEQNDS